MTEIFISSGKRYAKWDGDGTLFPLSTKGPRDYNPSWRSLWRLGTDLKEFILGAWLKDSRNCELYGGAIQVTVLTFQVRVRAQRTFVRHWHHRAWGSKPTLHILSEGGMEKLFVVVSEAFYARKLLPRRKYDSTKILSTGLCRILNEKRFIRSSPNFRSARLWENWIKTFPRRRHHDECRNSGFRIRDERGWEMFDVVRDVNKFDS